MLVFWNSAYTRLPIGESSQAVQAVRQRNFRNGFAGEAAPYHARSMVECAHHQQYTIEMRARKIDASRSQAQTTSSTPAN